MRLKTRPFLELARDAALEALTDARPNARVRMSMLQLFFDEPRQHYELWLRSKAGLVELGLHFEGVREDNLRRIAAVADAMPLIGSALGPDVELEEWTESWTRVHETWPMQPLDESFALRLGRRLADYVRRLEPVLAPLGPMLPPEPRAPGRRWHHRRGRGGHAARLDRGGPSR